MTDEANWDEMKKKPWKEYQREWEEERHVRQAKLRQDVLSPHAVKGSIELFCTHQGWMADFSCTSAKGQIMGLFKSHFLPLPFTREALGKVVQENVRMHYPYCEVTFRESQEF